MMGNKFRINPQLPERLIHLLALPRRFRQPYIHTVSDMSTKLKSN
jgi:hypothetical protein